MERLVLTLLIAMVVGAMGLDPITTDDATADYVPGPYCTELEKKYKPREIRHVSIKGTPHTVDVMWGAHAPTRAAAALLVAALRHKHGFRKIRLVPGPRTLCRLAEEILNDNSSTLVVHLGAEWKGREEDCETQLPSKETQGQTTGIKLYGNNDEVRSIVMSLLEQVMGPPPAPMTLRLHARLSEAARNDNTCTNVVAWLLYSNLTLLARCGFQHQIPTGLTLANITIPTTPECSSSPHQCIPVLVPPDTSQTPLSYQTGFELAKHIKESSIPLRLVPLNNHSNLYTHLKSHNSSILFLDYDLWVNDQGNRIFHVQPPLSYVEALRIGDSNMLHLYAPNIYDVVRQFKIPPQELRDVLQMEAEGLTIEEAACAHALSNTTNFDISAISSSSHKYWIYTLYCADMNISQYNPILREVGGHLLKKFRHLDIRIGIRINVIDCQNAHSVTGFICEMKESSLFPTTIGMTVVGEESVAAANLFMKTNTQLVVYDVPPDIVWLNTAVRAAAGRLEPLVRATIHFLQSHGWLRIAVISEHTTIAQNFYTHLAASKLNLRNLHLDSLNYTEVKNILQQFVEKNGRIFYVNAGLSSANVVLGVACEMGLTPSNGYVWVLREAGMRSNVSDCDKMRHFSVSYWWRGGNDSVLPNSTDSDLRQKLNALWKNGSWPLRAAPLAEALLLTAYVAVAGIKDDPSRRYDLHGENSTRVFGESFSKNSEPVPGVVQDLRQSSFALDQPLVFVEAWHGEKHELLSLWRVNSTSIIHLNELKEAYDSSPPDDGTSYCLTGHRGDPFLPTCHDVTLIITVMTLVLAPLVLWKARRARLAQLVKRDRLLQMRLLARSERTAAALTEHLVDRSALELHEEIGTGHFGLVRLGMLRLPHGPIVAVAVKALREEAGAGEEAEFLREACTLAALSDPHVVRLAGVCADGPPLLLMEHAFFGDLRRYLRERRYLARIDWEEEKGDTEQAEAVHVSPRELTRLSREAARALAHVARARYVHRDVRAANCLVDHARTLKLADFGMARATGSKAAGSLGREHDDYKYICQRRGVFPVPWMAPESLARGVFSSASDVWALGVLMLEVVTLGERPFGALRPVRVLKYVKEGGHPPLPRDATYHTTEVIEMCWRLAPDARPSAAAICDYLAQQPTALRPALRPAWLEPELEEEHQGDSGFDERDAQLEHDPHVSTM